MTFKYKALAAGLAAAAVLTGCGKDDTATESVQTEAVTDGAADVQPTKTEARKLDPITPSDYLVKNASDYVTLGSYDGIEINQYTYDVTDDDVQDRIEELLNEASTETDIDTPAAEGNIVYVTLTSTTDGVSTDPEDTYFTLGDMEYGEEFDQQLTGLKTGDTKTFQITFGDDIWIEDWLDKTVEFKVEVTGVTEFSVPEYNEEFLTTYTEYTSKEAFESALRESMENENLDISYSDAVEELFSAAVDATTINGYPEELFDSCRQEILSAYLTFADDTELDTDEILDLFGITEADIDAETLDTVNRRLLVSAYCEEKQIEVTEEEYVTFAEETAEYYGLEDAVEFEEQYTRNALVWNLYESKMADQLYQKAKVTKLPYSEEILSEEDFVIEDETGAEILDSPEEQTETAEDLTETTEDATGTAEAATETETTDTEA